MADRRRRPGVTFLDRLLQSWRIAKCRRFLDAGARVLDVGCADGALFKKLTYLTDGLGIDPEAAPGSVRGIELRRARLPGLEGESGFDAITALAVLEHVPLAEQGEFVACCRRLLKSGGRVVLTVPAPAVDRLLEVLKALHMLHGMETEEHYGFDPTTTTELFTAGGFTPLVHERFQLGLNHLFVFAAP